MQKELLVIKNENGFSLIEAIIATSVFAIIVTSVASSYFTVSKYILSSGAERQAIFLAEEGLEAVRNIQDNNFFALTAGGPYGISKSGNIWGISGSSDVSGIYTRKINITAPDADTWQVASKIEWTYKGENKSLTINREFTNWRKTKATASVSSWPFDDNSGCTASDEVGSNNATLKPTCPTDSPTWNTGTKRAGTSALKFDGSNDYVQAPDSNSLDLTTAGTLMAWINTSTNSTMGIINKGSAASSLAYYINVSNGRRLTGGVIKAGGTNGTAVTVQSASNTLPTSGWTHVAMTWDATSLKIYINGVLSNTTVTTALVARTTTGTLQIGAIYPTTSRFNGTIDEVSLYNVALPASEISTIFASQ
ncbi:MAG TPA: prepilin-type N-terminal cleavage/methylation domain-containing protein [Candidatus Moranbacteria bacterium]|nr:prepilin-type N-terminal cleavage/methylation domain-containing protein [Candidatus Moranbacteria bacterium]